MSGLNYISVPSVQCKPLAPGTQNGLEPAPRPNIRVNNMKPHRILVFLTVLFGLVGASSAADRRDGNWWIQLDNSARIFYLAGLIDGAELGHKLSIYGCFDNKEALSPKEAECLSPITSSYAQNVEKFIVGKPNK